MDETSVVTEATASPKVQTAQTTEAPTSFAIPKSGSPEYAEWRTTGEIPKPKTEAAATSEEKSETAGVSEAPKKVQEKVKQTAEERIAQLEATIDKIRKGSEQKKSPVAESAPAKTEAKPEYTRPKPTADDKKTDGSPKFDTYEDYIEELADWKVEQREATNKRETAMRDQATALNAKVEEAKVRYSDFADKVAPFVDDFVSNPDISPLVKRMVDDSDVFADLAYVLAGDDQFKEVAKNPGKAIRYIANVERLIAEELAGKSESARNDKGQFEAKVETPVKRGPETAPKPPIEISQRGNSNMDESERALQDIGRGNSAKATRAWMDAENRKDLARRRGA